jgi:5-methyltetrahydropteroyltriglutamate--homocysteine methyltransferase
VDRILTTHTGSLTRPPEILAFLVSDGEFGKVNWTSYLFQRIRSWNSPHAFDPPLSEVVDLVLQVRARYYSIEQAGARHEHEWRLWESVELPEGKVLIPGVVTHHTAVVEHPELVCERIVRLAKLVGRENVIGGTDCGFAGGAYVRRFHPSVQWAKLRALAEGAALASRQLWGASVVRA